MSDQDSFDLTDDEKYHLSEIRQFPPRIKPQSIRSLVGRLMNERGYAAVQGGEAIREAWLAVAGPELSQVAKPGVLRRGVLHILVADSLSLQELHFRKKELVERFQRTAKELRVNDLKFKLSTG